MAFAFAATLFAITPSAVAAHSERHLQVDGLNIYLGVIPLYVPFIGYDSRYSGEADQP